MGNYLDDLAGSHIAKPRRGQSSLEYISIYGWAFLILGIMLSVLYLYINEPGQLVTNSCNFVNSIHCDELVIMTNSMTHNTFAALFITNSQQYPLIDPQARISINKVNTTASVCTPSYVPPGGPISCAFDLGMSTQVGTIISGGVYLNATYCGLAGSTYQSSLLQCNTTNSIIPNSIQINTGQIQTYEGSFVGHVQLAAPESITFNTLNFTACGSFSGNIASVDGASYSCNSLTSNEFMYNFGTFHSYSFNTLIFVSTGTQESFRDVVVSNATYASPSGNIIIIRNMHISFNYMTQYYLTESGSGNGKASLFSYNASGVQCPSSTGSCWYDASSHIMISIIPPKSKSFIGWVGTGSGSYTGNALTATVTMNAPIGETAYYT